MILEIGCGDARTSVEVSEAGGQRVVRVGGRDLVCDCFALPNGHYSVILNGRVSDLRVELDGDCCSVTGRNGSYALRVLDPRRIAESREVEEGQAGLQRLCADMPGKVVRLLVREGEAVGYDQGLLVLEAMKMQNEIRAPKSGTVKEIGVKEGTAVNSGDFLISLE